MEREPELKAPALQRAGDQCSNGSQGNKDGAESNQQEKFEQLKMTQAKNSTPSTPAFSTESPGGCLRTSFVSIMT